MTVPDLSEFQALSKPRRSQCSIALALRALKVREREQLKAALAATGAITGSGIEQWLAKRGLKVADRTINRHRRGLCSCDD